MNSKGVGFYSRMGLYSSRYGNWFLRSFQHYLDTNKPKSTRKYLFDFVPHYIDAFKDDFA